MYTFTGNENRYVAGNWTNSEIPRANLPAGDKIIINLITGGSCVLTATQQIATGATLTIAAGKALLVPGLLTVQ